MRQHLSALAAAAEFGQRCQHRQAGAAGDFRGRAEGVRRQLQHHDQRRAQQDPDAAGQQQHLAPVRRRRLNRGGGGGQETRIGGLQVLLLRGLAHALQEVLVDLAVGGGLAFQLAQLDRGAGEHDRAVLELGEAALQRRLARARDGGVVGEGRDGLLHLGGDGAAGVRDLGAQVDDARMLRPVARCKLRLAPHQVGQCRAQRHDQLGGHHVGRRGRAAVAHPAADLVMAGLGLGAQRSGGDQFRVQLGDLLGRQLGALPGADGLFGLERLDGGLGGLDLGLQVADPLVQPGRGAARRLELRLQLIVDVEIRQRVRDQRRLGRVGRGHRDGDRPGEGDAADLQRLAERLDHRLGRWLRRARRRAGHQRGQRRVAPAREIGARGQGGVELGVAVETQAPHQPFQHVLRGQHPLLVGRGIVPGEVRDDPVKLDHPGLAVVEHHLRLGGVARRHAVQHQFSRAHGQGKGREKHPFAVPDDMGQRAQLDRAGSVPAIGGGVVGRGGGRGGGHSSGSSTRSAAQTSSPSRAPSSSTNRPQPSPRSISARRVPLRSRAMIS